jgi:hypothetical protein
MKNLANSKHNSVIIIGILQLTSLVKFANTQNIICKDMQHQSDLKADHE